MIAFRTAALALLAACLLGCNEPRYEHKTESQWRAELESGDAQTRRWAADALGAMKAHSEESDHALVKALGDRDDGVSVAAAKALANRPDGKELRDVILERLWEIAAKPGYSQTTAMDVLAIAEYQHQRTVMILAEALRDSSPAIKATAASSLRAFGKDAAMAIPALQAAQADTNELVRHEVRDALSAISGSPRH